MRALVVLALLGGVAHADEEFDPEVDASYVSGELRGTTAILNARYAVKFRGPGYAMSTTTLVIPDGARATVVVVHAPDGAHRLDLLDAEKAKAKFAAINNKLGEKRWALLVESRGPSLELSFAAPRDATVMVDVELQTPTCYYRDARYVQVPVQWKSVLSPHLRSRFGKLVDLATACRNDSSGETDELWIAFPSAELARRPAGIDRIGTNAARIDLGEAHIARLEVAVSQRLGEVPRDLATAILVDGSRSMTSATLEAQREVVEAYAKAAGDTQIQLISYARTARPLLASWTTARTARARLDRELRAIAPRNGSNVDAGFMEAARWLAQTTGTKRVVLVTDDRLSRELRARFNTLAKLLPEGTLVHVISVDEFSVFERDQHGPGVTLAESTGGIAVRAGIPETPIDATMLLRPIRIDSLELTTPGWKQFKEPLSTTCGDSLDEGRGCVWWGEGDAIAGPVAIEGKLWGKRVTRVVTPDASREAELARELVGMNILDERATERAHEKSRAAGLKWSFYAEWGQPGGYELGNMSIHGGHCCHSGRTIGAPQVRIGHVISGRALPTIDLSPQFAHVISRCNLGDAHVSALLELTDAEIVAVAVIAPPAVTRCVEDAIWETMVTPPDPRMFQTSSRIVLVQ
ncbi:MAG: VWA domain-containing protein [Myxococcota bacterium]|nr:VWA domain-containing protein [Myxococcota bacterium]